MINFDPASLASYFQFRDGSVTGIAMGVPATIVRVNPSRILLVLVSSVAGGYFRPILPAATNVGFPQLGVTTPSIFDFATYGTLVCQQWSSVSAQPTHGVYWLEGLYVPPGD